MTSINSLLATSLVTCLATGAAHAAGTTTTWTNLSGGSWSTPGNWSAAPSFAADDILDFSTLNITANAATTLDGTRTAGQLSFADATTASNDWTLNAGTGGSLTLSTNTGTPVLLVSNRTATINAPLNGTQGFQKTGTGALVLAGTNGYSGPTTVAAGSLTFNTAAAVYGGTPANWTAANLIANSGTTLAFRVGGAGEITAAQFTGTLLPNLTTGLNSNGLKAGATLGIDTTNLGGTITLSTGLADTTGTGGGMLHFRKSGGNTLAFTGSNTHTGLTTAAGGTVNVSGNQSAATGGWDLRSNATVNFNAGSTITVASGKSIALANDSSATHTLNVAGTVTGTGSLNVNAGGVLNINSGAIWIQNGGMTIQPNQSFSTPIMNVNAGGSFTYAGTSTISLSSSINSNGGSATLNLSGGTFTTGKGFNNTTTSSATAGGANLTFSNGGTLKLSADITSLATTAGRPFAVQVGTGGGKIDTNGFSSEIALPITGTGSLEKLGDGNLTLSGANTYSGATTVSAGTLLILNTDMFSDSAALALSSGASLDLGAAGTDTVGNFRIDGVTQAPGTWGAPGSGATHTTALITGPGLINNTNSSAEFYWDGTGTAWSSTSAWSFDPASAAFNPSSVPDATALAFFGGDGLVSDQTVQLGGNRGLEKLTFTSPVAFNFTGGGTNSALTVGASGITLGANSSGATFGSATANQQVIPTLGAAQTWTNASTALLSTVNGVSLGASTLTIAGSGDITLGGAVTGTAGFLKQGASMLTLDGSNTFTGDKTADRGSVTVFGNNTGATGSWFLRGYGDTGTTYNTVATTVTLDSTASATIASGKTVQLGNTSANGGFQNQTFNANGSVTNGGTLFIGRVGILNVGGAWTQTGTASVNTQGGGTATMNVLSGASFTYSSATQFSLTPSSTHAFLNIEGGLFTTGVKFHNGNATPVANSFGTLSLSNGGTLKLSAAITDLFTTAGANNKVIVGSGGGIVDTNGTSTTLNVGITGSGGLAKAGGGTLTTTGINSYTGNTTVTGGILSVAGPDLADEAAVTIASGAKLDLTFAGTDTIGALTINGVALADGTYSNSTHPAFITGSGTLTVVTPSEGYADWASGLGLSGDPEADFDKDGIADSVEYVLGTDPKVTGSSGITAQKSAGNVIFSFSRADESETSDVTLRVEAGTTLATWPQVFNIGATTAASSAGVAVTENGAAADTVTVTIPTSGAAQLFARLKVLVSGS
jgi:autotransporter-associated beta strand protein